MKFLVEGMTCGHCVAAITRAVTQLDAEARVQIDLSGGSVEVGSDLDPAFVAAAIESEGYVVRSGDPAAGAREPAGCCGGCGA